MKELGRYCTETQMFVEPPKEANMNHLRFLRGLAEKGKFDAKPFSVPKGANLFRLSYAEVAKYALEEGNQSSDQKIRQVYDRPSSDYQQTQ